MHNHVFVKVDLLLQKESFNALRSFLSSEDTDISPYCSLDIDLSKEQTTIAISKPCKILLNAASALIGQKVNDGYMLLKVSELKKLVNLT